MKHRPTHVDVVAKYFLDILKPGADLQLTPSGDLELTNDGGLKLGNDRFNAMFRLVERWRFNGPTLSVLFDAVIDTHGQQLHNQRAINDIDLGTFDHRTVEQFQKLRDEVGANEFGKAAYAGTVMVVLGNLLTRFKADLNGSASQWRNTPPLIGGHSLYTIIEAASTNFRHHDEWARATSPTSRQCRSMHVIAEVLGGTPIKAFVKRDQIRTNNCAEIILVVSLGQFEDLNSIFVEFAKQALFL